MARLRISKSNVDTAQPGSVYWDDKLAGFGLRVSSAGRKVYIYRYRKAAPGRAAQTRPITYTIGAHGGLTPDEARKIAAGLAARVAEGGNPQAEKNEKRLTSVELEFSRQADLWLEHYEQVRRASSLFQAKLVVRNHLKPGLKNKSLAEITRSDIQAVIDGIPQRQKAMRRAVFAYASVMFSWSVSRGDIARNPLKDMLKPEAPKARERILTDEELVLIWRASYQSSFGAFYRLLILTGQRKSEVATLQWSHLDRSQATWTIPAAQTKNGKAHIVPLSQAAVDELDALGGEEWPKTGYVISTTAGKKPIAGFSKAKKSLDAARISEWRVHDLRRTLATGLQRLGVRFEVTEAVINHISGSRGGVAGIYQRHDWKDEKRAALDAWANHLRSLLDKPDTTNILSFKSKTAL
jgi:integrase